MSGPITQLSIKALLSGNENYIIPMYQRNYAWEEGEITQLIEDIIDYVPGKQNYYIGTLVVFERPNTKPTVYETIDGQQRLTTLSLLASYLKKNNRMDWYTELKIEFESRHHSRRTFEAIFKGNIDNDPADVLKKDEINTAILTGYRLISKILPQKLKENKLESKTFMEYLFEKVQIMQVKVPEDTDLNHYFEIMNNRGEQLEKHEVLKSRMMEVLNSIEDVSEKETSQNCLHLVWEACANMERYVQLGFTPEQRNKVFGEKNWGQFQVNDFDHLREALKLSQGNVSTQSNAQTLDEIIKQAMGVNEKSNQEDQSPERFNTVINFQNFLLHVLSVESQKKIPLDDKRLIVTFEEHLLKSADNIENVKRFIFNLLKCKYLFDHYVIKREFIKSSDGWSLKRFKWNDGGEKSQSGRGSYVNTFGDEDGNGDENRRVLMCLSAFHVSMPTMGYKYWLNAALYYLFNAEKIQAKEYLKYLESIAKAFVFDRFLASSSKADYFDIIYTNKCRVKTDLKNVSYEQVKVQLSFENIENNLIFNYLDYLLWVKNEAKDKPDPRIKSYEFTFRSSVEHYYPQNPMPGYDPLEPETLNSFGNLCLISHSKNSRLSNFMPEAKKEYYKNNAIDSVKQHLMMQYEHWDSASIDDHYNKMKNVLLQIGDDHNECNNALSIEQRSNRF